MKKFTTICLTLILMLNFVIPAVAAELCLEYSASKQYNTAVQGENCWYYLSYANKKYSDMTFDTTRNSWRRPDGGGNYITATIMHPGVGVGTARVWEAPSSGKITIGSNGNVRKSGIGGPGVTAYIYKNDEVMWEQYIEGKDSVGYGYSLETEVSTGDRIYFLLTCETESYGATLWDTTITYNQTAAFEVNGENVKKMADVSDGETVKCTFYDKDEIQDNAIMYLLVYGAEDELKGISSDNINPDSWETRQAELSLLVDYGEDTYEGWESALAVLTAEDGRYYSVVMTDELCVK